MVYAIMMRMNCAREIRSVRGRFFAPSRSFSHIVSSRNCLLTTVTQPQGLIPLRIDRPILNQQHQFRSIFIQSEETPNPESIKFIPTGIVVMPEGSQSGYYVTKTDPIDSIQRSPLSKELFRVEGIKAVYLGADFVTVTKFAQGNWKLLRPEILDVMMNFFDSDIPALRDQPEIIDTTILDSDDEVVAMIKELIESRIRPAGENYEHCWSTFTGTYLSQFFPRQYKKTAVTSDTSALRRRPELSL